MIRDLSKLTNSAYDLLVIGGGIYGACIAWDAILRGLSVALVEKSDFGSVTSANSLKIIHGGFRYLQNADFKRMRESICERRTLMRIAPHLVHPLPVVIPTYRNRMQGKEVLAIASMVYDLIGFDRNRLDDPQKNIPAGRALSKQEVIERFPDVQQIGLTGGLLFYDAQVYNSERLVLSFLRSADEAGADLSNYVEVTGFLTSGDSIIGVRAKDVLKGDCFEIRAGTVVNAAGPWVNRVQGFLDGQNPVGANPLAKAVNVITRPLFDKCAVGFTSKNVYRDHKSAVNKGSRSLFLVPWRGRTLIGTTYTSYDGSPEDFEVSEGEVQALLAEVNQSWPAAQLSMDDVSLVHSGLLPSSGTHPTSGEVQVTKHYQIRDHRAEGARGLISVSGVKYTTARQVAEKVVDRVFASNGIKPPNSSTAVTPLYGGNIERFETFRQVEIGEMPFPMEKSTADRLLFNYGSGYRQVLTNLKKECSGGVNQGDDRSVWDAEIRHGVREEMAQKLSDVVFRRTELGPAGHPGPDLLNNCAETMGAELGWEKWKVIQELQEVEKRYLVPGETR